MLPENYEYTELEMSNFDHKIDDGFSEKLMNGNWYGSHPALNFCGDVYCIDNVFYEDVYQFHRMVETMSAENLEELMKIVNNKYGWE